MSAPAPSAAPSPSGTPMTDNLTAQASARALLGWTLILVLLAALSRTRLGYVVIYYALSLAILLLVLGSYPRVVDLLGAVRAPNGPSGG